MKFTCKSVEIRSVEELPDRPPSLKWKCSLPIASHYLTAPTGNVPRPVLSLVSDSAASPLDLSFRVEQSSGLHVGVL